jgi:hypothetical protein
MRGNYTGHISPAEWRWVIVVSSALILLALTPFLWFVVSRPGQWQFMGAIHDYPLAASELSKTVQGINGNWLTRYLHTPEPHTGVLLDTIYVLLGHVARITLLPQIVIFHVARIGATFFMYMAIYHLSAVVWMRVRTRRIFFVLAVTGSGLGWILAALTGYAGYLDIVPSTIFPFHTTLINVHYPLVIACLCMIASAIIGAIRPGSYEDPEVSNEGTVVFIFSLLLTLLYPQALLPVAMAFLIQLLLRASQARQISPREWRWMLWFFVPALPLTAYYISLFLYNPVVSQLWAQQSITAPRIDIFLLSLGLPLLVATPGIIRAMRKFEPDGNQFMIMWLITIIVMVFLLPVVRLNFAIGLMIPIAYFGTRSIEDYWFEKITRPWRFRILTFLVPLMAVSHFYVLFLPVSPLLSGGREATVGLVLEIDYVGAFQWLWERSSNPEVVLAAPNVTLDAPIKRAAVIDWYQTDALTTCRELLNGRLSEVEPYRVRYVLYGPQEQLLGNAPCLSMLTPRVQIGEVMVYEYEHERIPLR